MESGSRKAVLAALAANAGLALAKFASFAVTGSSAMLAEGVHSVADTSNQALLLWGGESAKRPPTPEHPFGYGRERYFWSFVVALVIFALGAVFAIYEGVSKLVHPHPISDPIWAVGVLLVGIALESFSLYTAVTVAHTRKRGRSWLAFVRDTKTPELPVVLLEDIGATLGLVLALVGVGLAMWTGNALFDSLATISIGVLLALIAAFLAIEMKSLLIGEAAAAADQDRIRDVLLTDDRVRRVIHMRTQHIGPDEILIGAKLEFEPVTSLAELSRAIDGLENELRTRVPAASLIYLEPDVFDADRTPAKR